MAAPIVRRSFSPPAGAEKKNWNKWHHAALDWFTLCDMPLHYPTCTAPPQSMAETTMTMCTCAPIVVIVAAWQMLFFFFYFFCAFLFADCQPSAFPRRLICRVQVSLAAAVICQHDLRVCGTTSSPPAAAFKAPGDKLTARWNRAEPFWRVSRRRLIYRRNLQQATSLLRNSGGRSPGAAASPVARFVGGGGRKENKKGNSAYFHVKITLCLNINGPFPCVCFVLFFCFFFSIAFHHVFLV